jgi:tetratricopeptide (TPR) repeat protein/arylsulfatase A-like enzyme
MAAKRKVILLGWDAADWKIISPLLDSGKMPALQRLIEGGVMGKIATLDPPLSPMLWTSIATGKTADKHGIMGFVEPDTVNGGIKPVTVAGRKTKALWNILMQNGYNVNVVGWWPGHPAEPVNGIYVSNHFARNKEMADGKQELIPHAVWPEQHSEYLHTLRVFPQELTWQHIAPFVPQWQQVSEQQENLLGKLAGLISSGASYHAVATWILEHQEWDFLALYLNEIDVFSHVFMKYHPPRQDHVDEKEFEWYKDVINGAYMWHDMLLDRLMDLAGDEVTFVLVSDHGFHSDHLRLKELPKDPVAPAFEHAPYGVVCISGPGIKKDERVWGASLLDITPTILHLCGLEVGEDMDGKVLHQAFDIATNEKRIPSWDEVPGDAGLLPDEMREDPWTAQEAVQQLIELGYIEDPGEDAQKAVELNLRESRFYLAQVYASTGRPQQAVEVLQELVNKYPEVIRFKSKLIAVALQSKNVTLARKHLNELKEQSGIANFEERFAWLEGNVLMTEGRPRLALQQFQRAEKVLGSSVSVLFQVAKSYHLMRNWADARRVYERVVTMDVEHAGAQYGLGVSLLRLGETEAAIEHLMNAVELLYAFPNAHYFLGEALYKYGDFERAALAFEVVLSLTPMNRRARNWLVKIYDEQLKQSDKAQPHIAFMEQHTHGEIIIVSGLPRSGTSMMMQVLEAGGLEIQTDKVRTRDEHNPEGYYEDERVKSLMKDNSWLKEAEGKVLKVVSPLLPSLPIGFKYKVIYMQRDLNEVMVSQQKMLGKYNGIANFNPAVMDAFKKQSERAITWMNAQPHVQHMILNYSDVVAHPEQAIDSILQFINEPMDVHAMLNKVNPDLYRNNLSAV